VSPREELIHANRKYGCADVRVLKLDRHGKSGSGETWNTPATDLDNRISPANRRGIVLTAFTVNHGR
jgi:hypothetical protein